jgi:hypothetical protein
LAQEVIEGYRKLNTDIIIVYAKTIAAYVTKLDTYICKQITKKMTKEKNRANSILLLLPYFVNLKFI